GSVTSSTPAATGTNTAIPPAQLQAQVTAAMQAADSFHMVGNVTDNGKPLRFDVHFGPGKAAGWIVENGQKIEVIKPGGAFVYFRIPEAMWRQIAGAQGDVAVAIFSAKWVKVGANNQQFQSLTSSFDKDAFIGEMTSSASGDSSLKLVGPSTVDGTAAVEYKSSNGSRLYIPAAGSPVILRLAKSGADGGSVTFSDYGKAYAFTSPPPSQTIDYSKLGH